VATLRTAVLAAAVPATAGLAQAGAVAHFNPRTMGVASAGNSLDRTGRESMRGPRVT